MLKMAVFLSLFLIPQLCAEAPQQSRFREGVEASGFRPWNGGRLLETWNSRLCRCGPGCWRRDAWLERERWKPEHVLMFSKRVTVFPTEGFVGNRRHSAKVSNALV